MLPAGVEEKEAKGEEMSAARAWPFAAIQERLRASERTGPAGRERWKELKRRDKVTQGGLESGKSKLKV